MEASITTSWRDWLVAHGSKLLLFARGWAPTKEDAEDLVQDAMIRMWHYQEQHGHVPPDLPLVYSTIRFCGLNLHRSQTRRRKREESVLYLNDFEDVWLDPTLEEDEDARLLRDGVQRLSPKLREVLILKFWSDLTFQQISETLAISPNTAASRYRYALEQLGAELKRRKEVRYAGA